MVSPLNAEPAGRNSSRRKAPPEPPSSRLPPRSPARGWGDTRARGKGASSPLGPRARLGRAPASRKAPFSSCRESPPGPDSAPRRRRHGCGTRLLGLPLPQPGAEKGGARPAPAQPRPPQPGTPAADSRLQPLARCSWHRPTGEGTTAPRSGLRSLASGTAAPAGPDAAPGPSRGRAGGGAAAGRAEGSTAALPSPRPQDAGAQERLQVRPWTPSAPGPLRRTDACAPTPRPPGGPGPAAQPGGAGGTAGPGTRRTGNAGQRGAGRAAGPGSPLLHLPSQTVPGTQHPAGRAQVEQGRAAARQLGGAQGPGLLPKALQEKLPPVGLPEPPPPGAAAGPPGAGALRAPGAGDQQRGLGQQLSLQQAAQQDGTGFSSSSPRRCHG